MAESTSDRWAAGDAYEAYMGRWSRALARSFLDWLRPSAGAHWLDVGCGTGALSAAVCAKCEPATVAACDPSAPFLEHARRNVDDARVTFAHAGADALPRREGGFDWIVSGLVLNFVPDPPRAVQAMRERLRPGGHVAAYVWDYARVDFLRSFWQAASELDPAAAALDEARRFEQFDAARLESLFVGAGLSNVEAEVVTIPTAFADFDDLWTPFLGGTGPAPGYVLSLEPARRDLLRELLRSSLASGTQSLVARASLVRGAAP